ncbi:hypothetical protein O573_02474, partial [Staphylococcus aureus M0514]
KSRKFYLPTIKDEEPFLITVYYENYLKNDVKLEKIFLIDYFQNDNKLLNVFLIDYFQNDNKLLNVFLIDDAVS